MAELAVNQHGETFVVGTDATHWMVRRMSDVPRGGPVATWTRDGRPIVIPIEATLAQFHAILREHGCAPGKYRLDPLDAAGRPTKGTPAYLPFPRDGQGGSTVGARGDELAGERPRNGNVAPAAPMVTPVTWSGGSTFPLPVPSSLSGAEYLI